MSDQKVTFFQARVILYDGSCGICGKTMRMVRAVDMLKRTTWRSITEDWEEIQFRYPSLKFEDCATDMHLIRADGRIFRGYYAYRSLVWVLPLAWPLIPLLYFSPVVHLGLFIYRRVADHRITACGLTPSE